MTEHGESRIPPQTLSYLAHPSLAPLWTQVRARLERNRLTPAGTVSVTLDEDGRGRLRGLLGAGTNVNVDRIRLDFLDTALRRSAAASGLTTVVAELTGPLVDRGAVRDASQERWQRVWARIDTVLADIGLANADWVPAFVSGLRRSGVLTRAGTEAAGQAVEQAGQVLATLSAEGALQAVDDGVEPRWELAALASQHTGDAHGLDDGRLAGALVLKAAAAAWGVPPAERPAQRRDLWARLGVTPDLVSGTVLVWSLRPPGTDSWSAMMRARAELGLVTHLTLQELAVCDVSPAAAGDTIFACENPQVLQAATRAGCARTLLCFAGNPASAGWLLVRRILATGAVVRYHGDFDWPGISIAHRLYDVGVQPWSMDADSYLAAVAALPEDGRLALSGSPVATPWDGALSAAMRRVGVAVHEEALLTQLLSDIAMATEERGS
jgi:uncharacterized protein (TIGR02679 family)